MGQQDFCRCLSILSTCIKWKGERKRERKEKINIPLDRAKRGKSKSKLLLIDVIFWPRIEKTLLISTDAHSTNSCHSPLPGLDPLSLSSVDFIPVSFLKIINCGNLEESLYEFLRVHQGHKNRVALSIWKCRFQIYPF